LHVESVAWVAERKDVLSTLFWLLTLAAYLGYVRRGGGVRYVLVVGALGLGLLAKPMLVTLPCVLLLLDWWPLQRWPAASLGRLVLEKIPLFALVLASCVVTVLAQSGGQAVAPLEAFPLAARLGNALLAYVGYLGQMFFPVYLAVHYPHPGPQVSIVQALGAGLFLGVVTGLVLGPGRRRPYLAVGWFWYLGTLVPVVGLVQVGAQAMADRYTYVPLIGIFLMLSWGAADLAAAWRWPRRYVLVATAIFLSACVLLTWAQVGHWKSNLHLWEHTAAVTRNNVLAHVNLGVYYHQQGRLAAALTEFEKAVGIDPRLAKPRVNLGNVLRDLGLPQQALAQYRQALTLEPDLPEAHFNLGNVLLELARHEEAEKEYRQAIALGPPDAGRHTNLGALLLAEGRLEEAEAQFRHAITLAPEDAFPHNNLGIVFLERGLHEPALAEFRQAIALGPQQATAHSNLGALLQEMGRLDAAVAEFRQALQQGDKTAGARLEACERLRALRRRLPGLLAGQDQPVDHNERLAFADLCRQSSERRYALAVRLCAEAFRADPQLAGDPRTANRFNAAIAATAAGCGKGVDGGLDDKERAQLRHQARAWLQADLALLTRQAHGDNPQARMNVRKTLRTWQCHTKLACVRDPAALALLPPAERLAWQKLWQEVEAALVRASTSHRRGTSREPP
jgi:tetratricopeptide (TPR) repeat protein